jgi:hypothetical protein
MMSTIFSFELKIFLRSYGLILSVFIFTVIGIFSLQQGVTKYQYQQTSIDSALENKERNFHKAKAIFDTLNYSSKERNSIEEPFVLEWKLQDVATKNLSPLSILSIGQFDIYSNILSGHFNGDVFKNKYAEFQNPETLLAGNLDVSYFILFLFPLYLLALTYNIKSADNEAGISPILNIQAASINKLINYRLLFRWFLAMIPVIIIALVSWISLSSMNNFKTIDWLHWWGIALVYAIFWLLIIASIIRFEFSSLINAITLAGIWVLLLIAIPGLLNSWFNFKYPSIHKIEIAEYRDFEFKTWDQPLSVHKTYIFSKYPELLKDTAKIDTNKIRSFSHALKVFNKEKELYNQISKLKVQQADAEEKCFWINPVGGAMRAFVANSQTTLKHQQEFERAVMEYRLRKLQYIFKNYLLEEHFTKMNFENMPSISYETKSKSALQFLLPILLLSVLVLVSILSIDYIKLFLKERINKTLLKYLILLITTQIILFETSCNTSKYNTVSAYNKMTIEEKTIVDSIIHYGLNHEALYTLCDTLKPMSSIQFYHLPLFSNNSKEKDSAIKTTIKIQKAINHLNNSEFQFILNPYERKDSIYRNLEIYVFRLSVLKKLIHKHQEFYSKWGITENSNPATILAITEYENKYDRWRSYGYLFGYPDYAVDFFVQSGQIQDSTKEFVKRDFFQIPVFASKSGHFTYAIPKGHQTSQIDSIIYYKAKETLEKYKKINATNNSRKTNSPIKIWSRLTQEK